MIHLRPIERRRIKADTRALKAAMAETHRRLHDEIAERRISDVLVNKHNAKLLASNHFKQTGEISGEN